MEHIINDKIVAIIAPSLGAMGYALVQVKYIQSGRSTLQIMAERKDGKGMTVEDCADISRNVSALLDVEDPISEAYHLEVSSPGIDRPLVALADFERFTGFDAKLESRLPIGGRKRFKGKIKNVEGNEIRIVLEKDETVSIAFDLIRTAKLVLTDELIKAAVKHNWN